jgi:predicted  nucleic acid-binding Zn-ribbon protein
VVSELDFVEVQLKAKEDRLLEIWQALEGLGEEIARLGEETPQEREGREAAEQAWERRRAQVDVELRAVEDELRTTQRRLGNGAMSTFKKLWASRKPSAVVPLDGTSCSACHAELRPSLVQQVRGLESLGYCDTCRRLLYDPEKLL